MIDETAIGERYRALAGELDERRPIMGCGGGAGDGDGGEHDPPGLTGA